MLNVGIRTRLTLWYGGVLAVVLVAFGAAIQFTMQHQMLSRIDRGLQEELSDVLGEVERADSRAGMLQWLDRRFGQHQGFDFQVTTTDGSRVFVNRRLGRETMPIPSGLASGRDAFESHERPDGPRWRIVTRQVDGPEGTLVVQVARSLEYFDHQTGELLLVLFVTGPLTLLVTLGGGYFLACRALAPVDRMTDAANRIGPTDLGRRLNVVNPNDELGRLAETLNAMLARLEKSFLTMQRFTADASHELRTPISVIRTEAEVGLDGPVRAEDRQNLLGNILEECQRLTWITDQLLTLSREDAGIARFPPEPVDLVRLAGDVADTMRPLAEGRCVELTAITNGEATVAGDADRLRHVAYNLLDNAIKYTPENGRVEIAVTHSGDSVRLSVCDTGIGIAPEHLPHVFERFYRVDKARSRAEGGTGLGLSIVESIVAGHGGRVEIQSQSSQGTTVSVFLPSQSAARQHASPEP